MSRSIRKYTSILLAMLICLSSLTPAFADNEVHFHAEELTEVHSHEEELPKAASEQDEVVEEISAPEVRSSGRYAGY